NASGSRMQRLASLPPTGIVSQYRSTQKSGVAKTLWYQLPPLNLPPPNDNYDTPGGTPLCRWDSSDWASWAPACRPICRRPVTSSSCTTYARTRQRRALATQFNVIFTSLPGPPEVEAVALGSDG